MNFQHLQKLIIKVDEDLDEEFHVLPIKEHRPSARVYERYDIWYCDYHGIDGLLVSYGDLLKKKDRLSRDMLIEKVRKIMIGVESAKDSSI